MIEEATSTGTVSQEKSPREPQQEKRYKKMKREGKEVEVGRRRDRKMKRRKPIGF
jgi:hypothetical protein